MTRIATIMPSTVANSRSHPISLSVAKSVTLMAGAMLMKTAMREYILVYSRGPNRWRAIVGPSTLVAPYSAPNRTDPV